QPMVSPKESFAGFVADLLQMFGRTDKVSEENGHRLGLGHSRQLVDGALSLVGSEGSATARAAVAVKYRQIKLTKQTTAWPN
ncbi:MAG TPA: hypothetical protein VMH37_14920, partial [Candidatus Binataceae bacterium]|nr:hypothetical protein [Candidatus Binataceae bacterium]